MCRKGDVYVTPPISCMCTPTCTQDKSNNNAMVACHTNQSLKTIALQWPWILLNVSLYAFAIPWMLSAIINQYFISKDYDSTLPGLDDSAAHKCSHGPWTGLSVALSPSVLSMYTWEVPTFSSIERSGFFDIGFTCKPLRNCVYQSQKISSRGRH